MAEYIERDELHKTISSAYITAEQFGFELSEDVVLLAIQQQPAVDLVPVVRCRDCKYRAEDCFCTGRGWPMQLVADDGFCEKGKLKDGGRDE